MISHLKQLCAAFYLASPYVSAAVVIQCPTELPPETLKISTPPSGWRPFVSAPLYLHSAGPMFGPPEQLGELIGKTLPGPGGQFTVRYEGLGAAPSDGLWLSCFYGEGNEFSLAQRLDGNINSCDVKYKTGKKAGQYDLDIRCK